MILTNSARVPEFRNSVPFRAVKVILYVFLFVYEYTFDYGIFSVLMSMGFLVFGRFKIGTFCLHTPKKEPYPYILQSPSFSLS
jgi:hypothetical protein